MVISYLMMVIRTLLMVFSRLKTISGIEEFCEKTAKNCTVFVIYYINRTKIIGNCPKTEKPEMGNKQKNGENRRFSRHF